MPKTHKRRLTREAAADTATTQPTIRQFWRAPWHRPPWSTGSRNANGNFAGRPRSHDRRQGIDEHEIRYDADIVRVRQSQETRHEIEPERRIDVPSAKHIARDADA